MDMGGEEEGTYIARSKNIMTPPMRKSPPVYVRLLDTRARAWAVVSVPTP